MERLLWGSHALAVLAVVASNSIVAGAIHVGCATGAGMSKRPTHRSSRAPLVGLLRDLEK